MLARCSTGERVTKSRLCEPCLMHPARLPCQTPSPELTPSQPSAERRLALELRAKFSIVARRLYLGFGLEPQTAEHAGALVTV